MANIGDPHQTAPEAIWSGLPCLHFVNHFAVWIFRTFTIHQDPVVQSIVSLTSLLRVISLTVLGDLIYNIQIFFAEKMWVAFALQKLLTFFQQKIAAYFAYHSM